MDDEWTSLVSKVKAKKTEYEQLEKDLPRLTQLHKGAAEDLANVQKEVVLASGKLERLSSEITRQKSEFTTWKTQEEEAINVAKNAVEQYKKDELLRIEVAKKDNAGRAETLNNRQMLLEDAERQLATDKELIANKVTKIGEREAKLATEEATYAAKQEKIVGETVELANQQAKLELRELEVTKSSNLVDEKLSIATNKLTEAEKVLSDNQKLIEDVANREEDQNKRETLLNGREIELNQRTIALNDRQQVQEANAKLA